MEAGQNQPCRRGKAEEARASSRRGASAQEKVRKTEKTGSIVYCIGKVLINPNSFVYK